MEIGGVEVQFVPGSTYRDPEPEICPSCEGSGQKIQIVGFTRVLTGEPCEVCGGSGRVRKQWSKAEARAEAVRKFQEAAQKSTLPAIQQLATQLLAMVIQYKGVGGTLAGSDLANQLREAADFMEDV